MPTQILALNAITSYLEIINAIYWRFLWIEIFIAPISIKSSGFQRNYRFYCGAMYYISFSAASHQDLENKFNGGHFFGDVFDFMCWNFILDRIWNINKFSTSDHLKLTHFCFSYHNFILQDKKFQKKMKIYYW